MENQEKKARWWQGLALAYLTPTLAASVYHLFFQLETRIAIVKNLATPNQEYFEEHLLQYIGNAENGVFAGAMIFSIDILVSFLEKYVEDNKVLMVALALAKAGAGTLTVLAFLVVNYDVETAQQIETWWYPGTPVLKDIPAGMFALLAMLVAFNAYRLSYREKLGFNTTTLGQRIDALFSGAQAD